MESTLSSEFVTDLLGRIGPMCEDIGLIEQNDEDTWTIGFADGSAMLAELAQEPPRIVFTAEIGNPPTSKQAAIFSIALQHNANWRENRGVVLARLSDVDDLALIYEWYSDDYSADEGATLVRSLKALRDAWVDFIERRDGGAAGVAPSAMV